MHALEELTHPLVPLILHNHRLLLLYPVIEQTPHDRQDQLHRLRLAINR